MIVAALDIGGTRIRASLVDSAAGRVVERAEAPMPLDRAPERVLDAAFPLLERLDAPRGLLAVALTGRLQGGMAFPLNTDTLPGWTGFPVRDALERRWGGRVALVNDARAAAYGEWRHGAGRGTTEFAFVTVSTGVGAGFVLGSRLHRAANGLEAELGFVRTADGLTLEATASGRALDREARERGFADARALADAAEAGDPLADEPYARSARLVAHALGNLAVTLGVERVALGGGVGLRHGYAQRVRAAVASLPSVYRLDVRHAELGADAGLVGAAAFAHDTAEEHDSTPRE